MLEPEGRQLLMDSLRAPVEYELDRAVATTYSLDLMALLAAPLGFALLDRESESGNTIADPVALLDAVRRYADRIDIFCQAGQIALPSEHRALLTYLEPCVHEVVPRDPEAIFHPKIWVLRFRRADGHVRTRLLCLSRNLTFDRSWDTVLQIEGESAPGIGTDRRLAHFVDGLLSLAIRPVSEDRAAAVRLLAESLESIAFTPPEGFERIAFWPIGLEPDVWPFQGRIRRLLIVSPFLTGGFIKRLHDCAPIDVLVSRPEALDMVGGRALSHASETMVLSSAAAASPEEGATTDLPMTGQSRQTAEGLAEAAGSQLSGLHAKLYVAEAGRRGRLWTGSANATTAAFGRNVEFLVELEGPKRIAGIQAVLGDAVNGVGMRKILEPYAAASQDPRELNEEEELERQLDVVRRLLAQQPWLATVSQVGDSYDLRLQASPLTTRMTSIVEETRGYLEAWIRPLALGQGYRQQTDLSRSEAILDFGSVSFDALTSFFVVDLKVTADQFGAEIAFVINAEMIGEPSDRRERVLASLLKDPKDLLRLLLMFLGELGADDLTKAIDIVNGHPSPQLGGWLSGTQALFEPMVKALASDPGRLDDINRLVAELATTEAGRSLLPPDWQLLWDPIWQTRQKLVQS